MRRLFASIALILAALSPAMAFEAGTEAVLDRHPLRADERHAIETRNFLALYDMGLHPYLGGQFARLIFGNEAGKGATIAVNKLVESLQGKGSVA